MALSFQELYKAARAKAIRKPKPDKLAKKIKENTIDRVKQVVKARKEKAAGRMDDEPKIDYTPRSRSGVREKPFATRALNLESKIKVQIDRKTWVYVDPDADIEAIKAKYKREPVKDRYDDLPPVYQF